MDFSLIPVELKKMIISYLDTESTKNIALTSKELKQIAYEKLWSNPTFTHPEKDIDFLLKISHLPIRELNVKDFSCSWVEIVGMVPDLNLLHIDTWNKHRAPLKTQLRHLKVPVAVHTNAFKFKGDRFDHFLEILETISVKELIIDHYNSLDEIWTFQQFKLVADKFHIPSVSMSCFDITENNILDYINLLAKLKSTTVKLDFGNYSLTIKELELMVEYDIQIIEIESFFLRTEGEHTSLLKFADVMRKMKYLKKFEFNFEDFDDENVPPMELLTDLPFRHIKSFQFEIFGSEDVVRMVETLSKIKSLHEPPIKKSYFSGFYLYRNYSSDYQYKPKDFSLLKSLPVKSVDLDALDLQRHNIKDFREMMNEMQILEIDDYYFDGKDFKLAVEKFGPAGIYRTIKEV
uniref:F-box domain-containing protein n=1 Tax=Clytia hemisphaerica TaxID=252671 RepID=A0A7M5X9I4_9CNID